MIIILCNEKTLKGEENMLDFDKDVKNALEEYNGKMVLKPRKGIKQYSGKISWYHVSFGEEIRTKLVG